MVPGDVHGLVFRWLELDSPSRSPHRLYVDAALKGLTVHSSGPSRRDYGEQCGVVSVIGRLDSYGRTSAASLTMDEK